MNLHLTKNREKILILVIPVSFLLLFLVFPILFTLNLSFLDKNTGNYSIQNYIKVLTSPLNQYFFYWTFQQAIITTFLSIILGLGGSFILSYYTFPGKKLVRNILTIPFLIPSIAVLIGFLSIYPINIIFSYEGIILANLFYNLPLMIRLTELGWSSINPEFNIVAKSLQLSRISYFFQIQFPHLLPTLLTASLLTFIYCFNSFAIVLILGGVQYQTIEVRIYSLVKSTLNYNQASALSIIQLIINIAIIISYLYFSSKYQSNLTTFSFEKIGTKKAKRILNFKKIIFSIIVCIYSILIFLICVLPLIGVFYKSLTSNIHFFTLKNYYSLFNPNIKDFIGLTATEMIVNSIIFAIIVAFLSIILALLFNYGLHYKSTKTGNPIIGIHYLTNIIVILPLMVSAITLIYSIFSLYRDTAIFDQVSIVIIISHVLIAFPFVNRIIATARVNLNQDMLDVGRSLGLNRFKVFLKIELPIIFSSLLVAGFFSFAISIGEFASTNFIARGNTATIPIGIYRLVETRHIGEASAYSSILILLTIFMFFIIEKVGKGIVDYKI